MSRNRRTYGPGNDAGGDVFTPQLQWCSAYCVWIAYLVIRSAVTAHSIHVRRCVRFSMHEIECSVRSFARRALRRCRGERPAPRAEARSIEKRGSAPGTREQRRRPSCLRGGIARLDFSPTSGSRRKVTRGDCCASPVCSAPPGRIRTCDTRFRKPMLYPLSYGSGTSTRVRRWSTRIQIVERSRSIR